MTHFVRNSLERASNTTISSADAEEKVKRYLELKVNQSLRPTNHDDAESQPHSDQNIVLNILNKQSTSDIKVGDRNVTNVNLFYCSKPKDKNILHNKCFVIIIVGVFAAIVTSVIFISKSSPQTPIVPIVPPFDWEANPPRGNLTVLQLPVKRVIVAQTADGDSCTTRIECIARVREIQASYNDLIDIPFNFLIGEDGHVYEGRGFGHQGELPRNNLTSSFDDIGLIVAFIGTFFEMKPSQGQLRTFGDFMDNSVSDEILRNDFPILLQDQLILAEKPATGLHNAFISNPRFYSLNEIISRSEWEAQEPRNLSKMTNFTRPAARVLVRVVLNNFSTCTNRTSCLEMTRAVQEADFVRQLNDINQNFLISDHGIIEGRGWDVQPESRNRTDEVMNFGVFPTVESGMNLLNARVHNLIKDGQIIGKIASQVIIDCDSVICPIIGSSSIFLPSWRSFIFILFAQLFSKAIFF